MYIDIFNKIQNILQLSFFLYKKVMQNDNNNFDK